MIMTAKLCININYNYLILFQKYCISELCIQIPVRQGGLYIVLKIVIFFREFVFRNQIILAFYCNFHNFRYIFSFIKVSPNFLLRFQIKQINIIHTARARSFANQTTQGGHVWRNSPPPPALYSVKPQQPKQHDHEHAQYTSAVVPQSTLLFT